MSPSDDGATNAPRPAERCSPPSTRCRNGVRRGAHHRGRARHADPRAGDRGVGDEGQALARAIVDDRGGEPSAAIAPRAMASEAPRPRSAARPGPRTSARRSRLQRPPGAEGSGIGAPVPEARPRPRLAARPSSSEGRRPPLAVHDHALALEHQPDPPAPEAAAPGGDHAHAGADLGAVRRARSPHGPRIAARPPRRARRRERSNPAIAPKPPSTAPGASSALSRARSLSAASSGI